MDPEDRNIITENVERLAELIDDVDSLVPSLLREKIFTKHMLEDIYGKKSDEARKRELLSELPSRGPRAFKKFVHILEQSGYEAAALVLKSKPDCHPIEENMSCIKIENEQQLSMDIDTVQSHQEKPKPMRTSSNVTVKPAKILRMGPEIYKMTSIPRGYCLIINNEDFKGLIETRFGSDKDARMLDMVFRGLGYEVYLKQNLEADEMRTVLKKFAQRKDLRCVDSCVVIILSHGIQDFVYGVDFNYVSIVEILGMFDNYACPGMRNKPKMFFIQACRGKNYDNGVLSLESSDAVGMAINNVPCPMEQISFCENSQERLPTCSDMMISYSVVKGYISIRNKVYGSWYGQQLASALMNKACDSDLTEILREVDSGVKKFITREGGKQATEFTFRGCDKKLYFNPGQP